jgi:large repetitive protein
MAHPIGTIREISGIVIARNAAGEERVLHVGDKVNFEDTISTIGAGSHVTLSLADGREIIIAGNDGVLLDQSVYAAGAGFGHDAVVAGQTMDALNSNQSVEDIQAALLAGKDINQLEATAAGDTAAGGAGGGNLISGFATAQYATGGDESTVLADQRALGDGGAETALFAATNAALNPNDSPVISDVAALQLEALDGQNTFNGSLVTATDADGDTVTYALVTDSVSVNTELASSVTVTVNADGTYTVTGDFNALAAGESATITFQYTANDGQGFDGTDGNNASSTSTPATVTLTITGTNDQPVVSDITVGAATEASLGTTYTNDTDVSISDNTTITSTIEITDVTTIEDLNVQINLTHTYDSDLSIYLIAPDGTRIALSLNNGDGDSNYTNTTFDDEASTSITSGSAPFSGTFSPTDLLSLLDGLSLNGTWTLEITDSAGEDVGTLLSWSLIVNSDDSGLVYESHDTTDVIDEDDTVDDVTTIFEGTLATASDDDASDSHTYAIVEDTVTVDNELISIPTVTVNADGTYSVSGDFNALAAGETVTITFQYVADDGQGFDGTDGVNESSVSEPATVTITITGTNDQPVVSDVEVSATETNGTDTFTFEGDLKLVATDADVNDGHTFYAVMGNSETEAEESVLYDVESDAEITIENISVNTDGTYSITGDFNALAVGETAIITFQYYAVDDSSTQANGESNTSEIKTVTITVTGTNDAPVISADSQVEGTAIEAGNLDDGTVVDAVVATGTMVATDVDHNATLTWSIDETTTPAIGTYGTLTIDATTGEWTYTVDSSTGSAADSLAEDESVEETFTVIVTDEYGATDTQVITITVVGTNDSPVISNTSTTSGTATEAGNLDDGTVVDAVAASGTVVATDVDDGAILTWSVSGSTTGSIAGTYGSFSIDADGNWIYTVDSSTGSAADSLAEGESVEETFTVIVTDEYGATATQVVTITVVGTNDVPVAVVDTNSVTERGDESIFEYSESMNGVAQGNLLANDTDVDHGADLDIVSVNGVQPISGQIFVAGEYGILHVDQETGQYEYGLLNTAQVNGLDDGETLTDTFTYTITDEYGATSTSTLTITVNGTNDAPTISVSTGNFLNWNDTVYESGLASGTNAAATSENATGTFTIGDVDGLDDIKSISIAGTSFDVSSSNNFADLVGQTIDTTYGTVTITSYSNGTFSYTYTLTSATTDVRFVTETDSFTVTVSDGDTTDSATVTINIADDAPITVKDTQTTDEDAVSITGNVLDNDKAGADGVQSVSFATTEGTYGTLSYDAVTGEYTYTLYENAQTLAEGEIVKEKFTYTLTDGDGDTSKSSLVITVTGTNDAPVATVEENLSVYEDDSTLYGQLVADDIDSDDDSTTLTYSLVGDAPAGFSLNADGSYSFDASNEAYQSLADGETQVVTFTWIATDSHDATTTEQTVTITITGTNDAPTVSEVTSTTTEDDDAYEIDLLTASQAQDVDSTDTVSYVAGSAVITSSSDAGGLSVSDSGVVSVDPSYYNYLDDSESVVVTYSFEVTDGIATTTNTATITINGVNDAPVFVDVDNQPQETYSFNYDENSEAGTLIGTVTATDVDGDEITYSITSGNDAGYFAIDATTGEITLTEAGAAAFTNNYEAMNNIHNLVVSADDGTTTTSIDVTLSENDVNDAPEITLTAVSINENDAVAGTSVASFSASDEEDGTPSVDFTAGTNDDGYYAISGTDIVLTEAGAAFVNGGGTLPEISLTATDSGSLTATAIGTPTVVSQNDAPDAVDNTYVISGLSGQYYAYHEGTDGSNLSSIAQAEAFIAANDPDATFDATAIDYGQITGSLGSDGNLQTFLGSDASTLSTDPENSSDAIIKLSGSIELDAGTYTFKVTADDGFSIVIDGVTVASYDGNQVSTERTYEVTITESGTHSISIVYWDQAGESQLKVEISDDGGETYSVLTGNSLSSIDDALVTNEDTPLTIAASTLLGNDTDEDGDTLSIISVQGATNGTVTLNDDGTITFTPEANYNGEATFTYTISDGNGGTDTATVTLYVNAINDAPVAADDAFKTDEDTALTMDVLGNDTDEDNDTLSVTEATSDDGTVTINDDGTLNFTPNANFTGVATITYTISDGNGGTDTATVLVTVNAVEHTPTLSVDTGNEDNANDTVLESGLSTGSSPSASDTTAEGTFTVSDPDGLDDITSVTIGTTTFTIGTDVGEFPDLASLVGESISTTSGTVEITAYNDGVFSYTYTLTTASSATSDSFDVSVTDGSETASETVTIDITDDAPIAYNDAVSLVEGTTSSSGGTTNILLVLDFSGSMAGDNLTAMKEAVAALIEAYDNAGDFNLKIVTFGTDAGTAAVAGVFTTLQSVIDWLATVDSSDLTSGTNYDTAISTAMSAWTAADIDGADASNSIVYFISDGSPSNNHGLSTSEVSTWEDYVDANFSKAIAIGIGSSATAADTDLQAVAYTPGGSDEVYLVTNLSELTDTLVGTVETPATSDGSVVTQTGVLNLVDVSGADGWDDPKLVSVEYDGVTYTFTDTTTSFTIVTDAGTVTIDNEGNYSFTSLTDVANDVSANITYTVVDSDGSTDQAVLTVTTLDSSETVAVSDTVTIVTSTTTTDTTATGTWNDNGNRVNLASDSLSVSLNTNDNGSNQTVSTTSQSFTVAETGTVSVTVSTITSVASGDSFTVTLNDGTTATVTASVTGWGPYATTSWTVTGSINASWDSSTGVLTFTNVSAGEKIMTITATKLDATFSSLRYPSTTTTTTTNVWDSVGTEAATLAAGVVAITGNVLTNDLLGSEGATITQIDGTTVSGTSVSITGDYGTLVINTETGAYTYTLNSTASAGDVETFVYTLAQADGDTSTANLTFNFASSVGTTGTDGADTLVASDDTGVTLYGGEGDDHLIGGAGNDTLYGEAGSDTLEGGAGNDYLDGGAGSDALYGGAGNDTLVYDASDSIIDGGAGTDTLLINASGTVDLSNVAAIATSIEVLDLTQASVAVTNINVDDVISLTEDSTTHILKITGESNDSISGTGWTATTDTTNVETGYTRYESTATDGTKAYVDVQDTVVHTDFN